MKRDTAINKSVEALGVQPLPASNDHILAMADVLQRECDQREGLIEMASAIMGNAGIVSVAWHESVERWRAEKEKLLNDSK